MIVRSAYSVNPPTCVGGDRRRDGELLPGGDHIHERRAVVLERGPDRSLEVVRLLHPLTVKADGARDFGEVRVLEPGPVVHEPRRLHLHLDEVERGVVEDDES